MGLRTSFRDSLNNQEKVETEEPVVVKEYQTKQNKKKSKRGRKAPPPVVEDETGELPPEDRPEPSEDALEVKPKKKKRKWLRRLVTSILLLLVVGFGITFAMSSGVLESTSDKVSGLYTDSSKSDIISTVTVDDLDIYYAKAGDDESLVSELDTIALYLSDKELISSASSSNVELNEGLVSITTVSDNLENYTVTGLALTMSEYVNEFMTEYGEYTSLRNELTSISDYATFDENLYIDRLDKITHTENREELDNLVSILNDSKAMSESIAGLQGAELDAKNAEIAQQASEIEEYKSEIDSYQKKADKFTEDIQEVLEKYLPIEKIEDGDSESSTVNLDNIQDKVSETSDNINNTIETVQEKKNIVENIITTVKSLFE
jgi:hypothetical protein